ncbi:MAG: S41 family peptidase [Armatimonadota bacterium]|nr:S41 family peptidase [Armatimonadota bacterium]
MTIPIRPPAAAWPATTPPGLRAASGARVLAAALLLVVLVVAPARADAQAASPALVFEALQVLQAHYVDPVDVPRTLAAAVAALRRQLADAGIAADLPDLPPGLSDAEAQRAFAERFAAAADAAAGRIPAIQLAHAAIRGMADSFNDSHTGFLSPEQNAERRRRQQGQPGFSGVGIVLMSKDGRFYVGSVIPGGPADAAGVRAFDRIVQVNDIPTGGLTVDQVSALIRGPAGTPVTLTLKRPGISDPVVVTVTRAPIVIPSIFRAEVLPGGIGYLRLYQFVERTGREVRAALARLLEEGMRSLVLDLRGNGGGYLDELTSVFNALLPPGTPVYTERRQGGAVRTVRTTQIPLLPPSLPVVVLVDDASASAAELLAAAVQESRRGVVVGSRTAGAVEASVLIDLSDGSALSVTTIRLATGRGVRLEGAGVTPDVVVELTADDLEAGVDPQFLAGVRTALQALGRPGVGRTPF